MLEKPPIDHIVRTIAERFEPERIILFGNYARGEAGPDSDVDLFVEMESDLRLPERAIEIDRAFGPRRWAMDVVVYTLDEARQLRPVHGTLPQVIEKEGKVVYERGV